MNATACIQEMSHLSKTLRVSTHGTILTNRHELQLTETCVFGLLHIRVMQSNHAFNDSAGNWIAFLFGATFNLVTHMIDSGPASYLVHAIAGGIICLMFKMVGDLFTPLVQRLGIRIMRWLEGKLF